MKIPDPYYWSKKRAESLAKNPIKRSPLKAKPIQIKRVGKKREKMKTIYGHLRNEFMEKNEYCQARLPECTMLATDVHHKAGRSGEKLIDETNFLAVCRSCHNFLEGHPKIAKEMGFSVSRLEVG